MRNTPKEILREHADEEEREKSKNITFLLLLQIDNLQHSIGPQTLKMKCLKFFYILVWPKFILEVEKVKWPLEGNISYNINFMQEERYVDLLSF